MIARDVAVMPIIRLLVAVATLSGTPIDHVHHRDLDDPAADPEQGRGQARADGARHPEARTGGRGSRVPTSESDEGGHRVGRRRSRRTARCGRRRRPSTRHLDRRSSPPRSVHRLLPQWLRPAAAAGAGAVAASRRRAIVIATHAARPRTRPRETCSSSTKGDQAAGERAHRREQLEHHPEPQIRDVAVRR